jgi:FSR family fosmidomycin resistance protein-like MFS transporter
MFRNRMYLSVVSSHFVVDMFNGVGGVLLAVLSVPLGLSNAQVGLALTLALLISSVSQPLFGWLTDGLAQRSNGQGVALVLLAGLSALWMAIFYGLIPLVGQSWWLVLTVFLLGSLGSGLFHPLGTALATSVPGSSPNMSTATFFVCGQMGLALGPILGGFFFDLAGISGILPMALLAIFPMALTLLAARRHYLQAHMLPLSSSDNPADAPGARYDWGRILRRMATVLVLAFLLMAAVRSSMQATFQFLLPKLLEDRGWQASHYGLLAGTFMACAAIGNVIIGRLTDRFGLRAVVVASLLLSVPAALTTLMTPLLPLAFVAAGLAGFLIGGQHSVLVVHAQELLPVKKGLASGLILGFTFASGAVGTWLTGLAGDVFTLQATMQVVALLGLPAALLGLMLPGRQSTPHAGEPAAAPAPVAPR